jgi:hypothetical protein
MFIMGCPNVGLNHWEMQQRILGFMRVHQLDLV